MYTRHVDVHMYVVAYMRSMGRGMKGYPRYRKTLAHPSAEIWRACRGCRLLIMRTSDTRCLLTVNARVHSTTCTIHFEGYGLTCNTKETPYYQNCSINGILRDATFHRRDFLITKFKCWLNSHLYNSITNNIIV